MQSFEPKPVDVRLAYLSEVDGVLGVLLEREILEQLEEMENRLRLQVLDQRRQQVVHLHSVRYIISLVLTSLTSGQIRISNDHVYCRTYGMRIYLLR